MAAAKARDKRCNNQPSMGVAKARRQTMEGAEDATTNHSWQRQASASDESKRTVAGNGWQSGLQPSTIEIRIAP